MQSLSTAEPDPAAPVPLDTLGAGASATADARRIMDRVAVSAMALGHADAAYVEEVDAAAHEVEVVAVAGTGAPRLGTRVPLPGSLAEEVLGDGEPEIVDDVALEGRAIGRLLAESCGRCSALVVPLVSEGEALGALILLRAAGRATFTADETLAVRLMAEMAALSLRRAAEERRFRALYEDNPSLFFTLDDRGAVVGVNRSAAEALGYGPEELVGRPMHELIWEDDRPRFAAELAEALAEPDRVHRLELRKRHRLGTPIWVRESLRAVRGPRGRQTVLTVCEDITDRVAVEEALRQDRALLQAQSEALEDGLLMVSPEGRLLSYNRAFLQMWGIPDEAVAAGLDEDAVRWAATRTVDPEGFQARVRQLYADPDRVSLDELALDDGRVLERYGGPVRGADGERYGHLWFFRDVTVRKRTEEAQHFLGEAGRLLATSLDLPTTLRSVAGLAVPRLADWCVIDLREEDRIERVAVMHADPAKAAVIAEYQRRFSPDAEASHGAAVIRTGRPVVVAEVTDQVLQQVAREPEQLAVLRELGFASAIAVPLVADEKVLGAITLISAESRRRYGEHDLRLAQMLAEWAALAVDKARAYAVAQEASRTRDEVLSVVSHDLRNPIGTILTSAAFIPEMMPDAPPAVMRQLAIIRRQAEQANRLIQDLLDVSRIEAGRLPIDPLPLAPRLLLAEAHDTLRPLAESKGLRLRCDTRAEVPAVCADRDRLVQALGNLVGNAVRYTPEGGEVTLRAEPDGTGVRFSVSDTGQGIPAEHLPHLFDRFFQVRQQRRGGAGLGLAIVKGIVEAHGGEVRVESQVGVGTTFSFTIPAAAPAG